MRSIPHTIFSFRKLHQSPPQSDILIHCEGSTIILDQLLVDPARCDSIMDAAQFPTPTDHV